MALTINLLHEQQKLERQKQLDPLKLGIYLIVGIVAFFVAYDLWEYLASQSTFGRRDDLRAQWSKKEKELAGIAQLENEFKTTTNLSTLLLYRIDNRFHWGPFLETLSRVVPPEVQIVSMSGSNARRSETVTMTMDGMAAGPEPRAAAEKFRLQLIAGIGAKYANTTVIFRSLDESGGTVKLEDKDLPTARFSFTVTFKKPYSPNPPPPPPAPPPKGKR